MTGFLKRFLKIPFIWVKIFPELHNTEIQTTTEPRGFRKSLFVPILGHDMSQHVLLRTMGLQEVM